MSINLGNKWDDVNKFGSITTPFSKPCTFTRRNQPTQLFAFKEHWWWHTWGRSDYLVVKVIMHALYVKNNNNKVICICSREGGGHSFLYFAYTCAHDLFIRGVGLFTLQKGLQGMEFFRIKVNACILIHLISNYNFLGELFKNTLFDFNYIFLYTLFVIYPK